MPLPRGIGAVGELRRPRAGGYGVNGSFDTRCGFNRRVAVGICDDELFVKAPGRDDGDAPVLIGSTVGGTEGGGDRAEDAVIAVGVFGETQIPVAVKVFFAFDQYRVIGGNVRERPNAGARHKRHRQQHDCKPSGISFMRHNS